MVNLVLKAGLATLFGLGAMIAGIGLFIRQPSSRVIDFVQPERSDPARLEAHVRFFAETVMPRSPAAIDNLNRAADYILRAMADAGGRVEEQRYRAGGEECRNIIARFGPKAGDRLVVGAHYDAFGGLPGADDNASGAAGLLEIARLLGKYPPTVPVELVAFSTEEPPYFGGPDMGSAVHARSLRDNDVAVLGMICLEMIGYFTERQPAPHWIIGLLYPSRGDFITVVGRWQDRELARHVKAGIKGSGGVRACSFTGPPILGADLSDHRNYWNEGYPAVMITDTAFIRNPHYHTEFDLPETLDYNRMSAVTDGVFNAICNLEAKLPN